MQSLNVAHILSSLDPTYGGPPRVAHGLGDPLDANGCNVSYWSTSDDPHSDVAATQEFRRAWPKRWYRAPGLANGLKLSMSTLDILHIHEVWSYPQYAASNLARKSGKAFVLTPHGELTRNRLRHGSFVKHLKKLAYLRVAGRAMLDAAACVHAISDDEVKDLRLLGYRGPVTIIPNAVNPREFADLPSRSEAEDLWPALRQRRVVLFLSRLSPEKGLNCLLPAWQDVIERPSFADALLVLAGPDYRGYAKHVAGLVCRHNLRKHVLSTGMVGGKNKLALLARADLFVLPSHGEGCSIALLENLAAGNPVLITPGCSFPEVENVGAGLCVPVEAAALAAGLRWLLELSPLERRLMGQRGRKLILERYAWENAARKMIGVYRNILSGEDVPLHP